MISAEADRREPGVITAIELAEAFGLATADALLERLRHGDYPTWVLSTADGRFVAKELAPATGALRYDYVERAIGLERAARAAGIPTAEPVTPVRPVAGGCAEIPGRSWYRAHRWIDHRPPAERQIDDWLGRMLAELHRLRPAPPDPDQTAYGVHPAGCWHSWAEAADRAGHSWAEPARTALPFPVALTDRIRRTHRRAPDWVITHADLEPHNILLTAAGPVLIDWDTVWPYGAALQAGHVAYRISDGCPDRAAAFLDRYRAEGGRTDWAGRDLFLGPAAQKLAALGQLITGRLGLRAVPRWAGHTDLDRQLANRFALLPGLVDELDDLAGRLVARPRRAVGAG